MKWNESLLIINTRQSLQQEAQWLSWVFEDSLPYKLLKEGICGWNSLSCGGTKKSILLSSNYLAIDGYSRKERIFHLPPNCPVSAQPLNAILFSTALLEESITAQSFLNLPTLGTTSQSMLPDPSASAHRWASLGPGFFSYPPCSRQMKFHLHSKAFWNFRHYSVPPLQAFKWHNHIKVQSHSLIFSKCITIYFILIHFMHQINWRFWIIFLREK